MKTNRLTRRVSDEVFDESFCEFFIPTEDCPTKTKLTGLGNTRKLFKMEYFEVFNERDFVLSIQQSNSKIGKTKNLWTREMGNPTGEEITVPPS
jgi:hypothetical protein